LPTFDETIDAAIGAAFWTTILIANGISILLA